MVNMYRKYFLSAILILALTISLFAGCQVQNVDVPSDPTEPSASSQPTEPTEPSSEATDPTESTVCPRTIEYFKSYLTPHMTYSETLEVLGRNDKNVSPTDNHARRVWYLEDDYRLEVYFFPVANEYMYEYFATVPTDATNPDGTANDGQYYLGEWYYHMEACIAYLYEGEQYDKMEVWFDYGNPWLTEEAS